MELAAEQAQAALLAALNRAMDRGELPRRPVEPPALTAPRDPAHGDLASSLALRCAKAMGLPAREVAGAVLRRLDLADAYFDSCQVAGPGFLNLTLGPQWYGDVLRAIQREGADYGRAQKARPARILVAYDPQCPRCAALADSLCNLLRLAGDHAALEHSVPDAEHPGFDQAIALIPGRARPLGDAGWLQAIPVRPPRPAWALEGLGPDAARYFLTARPAGQPIELDPDLATRQDTGNPLYHVQYAHARMLGILRSLAQDSIPISPCPDYGLLTSVCERRLVKVLALFPQEAALAASSRDPSRMSRYATQAAAAFYRLYTSCRIKCAESAALRQARANLIQCAAAVIRHSLRALGVSAPEHM